MNITSTGDTAMVLGRATRGAIIKHIVNSNTGDYIGFAVNPSALPGLAETLDVVVDEDGNLGIGTTNPGSKLDVQGNANVSQTLNAPVINTTQPTQNITITSGGGSVIIRLG